MEPLQVKRLHPAAVLPTRAHPTDAGLDLYMIPTQIEYNRADLCEMHSYSSGFMRYPDMLSESTVCILPHHTVMLRTGLAVAIPVGYMGCVYARSGLSSQRGLAPANCVGVIDSDYRGEILVPLHNYSTEIRTVSAGERIAQLVVQPVALCPVTEVQSLDVTQRGTGGFGSTGVT